MENEKIINDPIYGFIKIRKGIISQLIDHPYFQRLRRISQLGLSYLVYPGANHSRFHHAIGCLHLMSKAINQIREKGHEITNSESEALQIAILLHDIGHGPFSHALEHSIASNISHEKISNLFMHNLNEKFNGKLSLAIKIFNNQYKKKFLYQLVCSQLDMDRLDYLNRDSFFSGVTEGKIGTDRIISMLNVTNDTLVVEEKGIYSVEKFVIARRLMYWQVYYHKTVIVAENMLINILQRAREIVKKNKQIYTTPAFKCFLAKNQNFKDFENNQELLDQFSEIDDFDIYTCLKQWRNSDDLVLSSLSKMILNRKLLKIKIQNEPFTNEVIQKKKKRLQKKYNLEKKELDYFIFSNQVINKIYDKSKSNINILMKNGEVIDLTSASDQFKINDLNKVVVKYFLCYPNLDDLPF